MTDQEKTTEIQNTINRIFGGSSMPVPSSEDKRVCEENRISLDNRDLFGCNDLPYNPGF